MVDRVKDYYGSWFAKPEENQSPQGNYMIWLCKMLLCLYDMILILMLF
jgi:hypothetical protein